MPHSDATNPMTVARLKLIQILKDEFADEQFPIIGDVLHKSVGRKGTRIGVSPLNETPLPSNSQVERYSILVQFYGKWKDEISPDTRIDPTKVEGYAERFKRALRGNDPDTDSTWFFSLAEIGYPHDPTGNATRFEARVNAFGNNTALIETTG